MAGARAVCTLARVSDPASPPRVPARVAGRAAAYALTWLSYASYYLGRKGLPVAKATIEAALGKPSLYGVETAYLAAYALGMHVNGFFGDRVGARRLIGAGHAGVGAGVLRVWRVGDGRGVRGGVARQWARAVHRVARQRQGDGRVDAPRAARRGDGRVVDLLSGGRHRRHRRGRALPPGLGAAVGVPRAGADHGGRRRPGDPLPPPRPAGRGAGACVRARCACGRDLAAARRRLLRSPTIWSYGVCYFWLKLIRYSLLLWLPYYLEKVLGYDTTLAADVSTAFEWGGVAGAVTVGLLSDRLARRGVPRVAIAAACLVGLAGGFWIYLGVGGGVLANVLGLALVGFLLFGPDSLVSGTAAQDAGGPQAAALAAGLINGIGSVGAVFQEAVTRGVSARWGWDGLFRVFVVLSLVAAASLAPALRRGPGPERPA